MSQGQKETLLTVYRGFTASALSVIAFFVIQTYMDQRKIYDLTIKHEQQIQSQGKEIDHLRADLNKIIDARNHR